ncbi:histidinol-phosphatase [Phragmitibacter flavus]|uniref:Histidinol-phosphatase n=2 Tax=Phragmitibacter flavus TaxID=2576071 RepID=A0A5R8KEH5_9BACT|nr:histidinol-phosphatase [Phragmitibacter flavus]
MMKDEVIYVDSHMHTTLCKHAFGEPEEYAEMALQRGLKGMIITCHGPMPDGFWPQVRMDLGQFEEYVVLVERCRKVYEGRLEVRLGLESDYFPGMEEWAEKLHAMVPLHYVLGSVHWQGSEYRDRYGDTDEKGFRVSYFENLAASAETGLFDCLSHPDLIKNFMPGLWRFEDWEETIAASLDRIAKTGVAMELNTSGLNKVFKEMNPGPQMLAMMAQRGIPLVIGSDSHVPHRVGDRHLEALEMAQQAGWKTISVFKDRKRQELPIVEVRSQLVAAQKQAQEVAESR